MGNIFPKSIGENIRKVIVGKAHSVELLLVGLIAEGHVLIEDMPGLGKTLLAKTLAKTIGGHFRRVQFTPDLLPSDVTGFNVFDQRNHCFTFHPGPVMTNILLADEINRTIPRTQSSLLEAMEERQVTVDGHTYPLPLPFMVLATQNPIEMEGTFPLPEAQLDRFLLRLTLGYPTIVEEVEILTRFRTEDPLTELPTVSSPEEILRLQALRRHIKVSAPVADYIARLSAATRNHPGLRLGVSPRGSLALLRACQALALIRDRDFVLPDDVKELAAPVLSHRVLPRDEIGSRHSDPSGIIAQLLDTLPVAAPYD